MPRKGKKEELWFQKAAELMVRESKSLLQAVNEIGVPLSAQEAETFARRKAFQRVLWTVRQSFFQEVGSDPTHTKEATVGQMALLAAKLTQDGDYDKAADVLFKVAKMEDWVGAQSNINIFANLTERDLQEIKKTLSEGHERENTASTPRISKTIQ